MARGEGCAGGRHWRWLEGFETGRQEIREDLRDGQKELEVGRGHPKRRTLGAWQES